jgi:hypothetical protein
MKRRNRGYEWLNENESRLANREPIVTARLAVPPNVAGAVDDHERSDKMHRIAHTSRALIVSAVILATAVLMAALPLVAAASNGGPGGS